MSDRSGVSRGDRNRNARLSRLREAVPLANAIVGVDLADIKQMVVVTNHESQVLARRTFRLRAWELGTALDWAAARATAAGFAGVTVAVEPTGHRWRVVGLAADRQMAFVCVQPLMSSWARRAEDLTFDKTDDKDAVLIARLTGQLRCYLPERPRLLRCGGPPSGGPLGRGQPVAEDHRRGLRCVRGSGRRDRSCAAARSNASGCYLQTGAIPAPGSLTLSSG